MIVTTPSSLQIPVWLPIEHVRSSPLEKDAACDVCVVGAGIAGLLTAERLSDLGLDVMLLDSGPLYSGETARTTAHVVTALDDRYVDLERLHGAEGARLLAQSHGAAIDHIEDLIGRLGIECEWRRLDGYLTVGNQHRGKREELLDAEAGAATRAGINVERVKALPSPWPLEAGSALRFPDQAQMHPLKLLRGVARGLARRGVRVHTNSRVTHIEGGDRAVVGTELGSQVRCAHIVVATNTPISNLVAVHTKQNGYQSYVMAFEVAVGALPPLLMWDGLWENDVSYHYVRLMHGDGVPGSASDLLIVGGEDHRTGQGPTDDAPYQCIERWTRSRFPMCGEVRRRWSGEVMEPVDGIAYIGHNAMGHQNVYIVTGDSGNGMTHGAIAAMLIPDQITGRAHPWTMLYDPARKVGMHALGQFGRESLNTLAQYRDWFGHGEVKNEDEIRPDEGAILVHGLRHLAIYKDKAGQCTRLSAVCPHLGGIVRWNNQEKTWDCPCHASRFHADGTVMHGPANANLRATDKA